VELFGFICRVVQEEEAALERVGMLYREDEDGEWSS
jgi:hypothetical protein